MLTLSFVVCFHFNLSLNILHVIYLNRGRYVNTLNIGRHSWRCFNFENVVGKRPSARPWPAHPPLLANPEAVLQRNPKQIFFQLMGIITEISHDTSISRCSSISFPHSISKPFKIHIYRPKFALTSFEKSCHMGGEAYFGWVQAVNFLSFPFLFLQIFSVLV